MCGGLGESRSDVGFFCPRRAQLQEGICLAGRDRRQCGLLLLDTIYHYSKAWLSIGSQGSDGPPDSQKRNQNHA